MNQIDLNNIFYYIFFIIYFLDLRDRRDLRDLLDFVALLDLRDLRDLPPLLDFFDFFDFLLAPELDLPSPILNILVLHLLQLPFIAGLPFFIVVFTTPFISFLTCISCNSQLHLTYLN